MQVATSAEKTPGVTRNAVVAVHLVAKILRKCSTCCAGEEIESRETGKEEERKKRSLSQL